MAPTRVEINWLIQCRVGIELILFQHVATEETRTRTLLRVPCTED